MKRTMLKLTSIRPHKYGTRHMTAGEDYEAPTQEAIAQVALRNADFAKPAKRSKPAASVEPPVPEPEPTPPPPEVEPERQPLTLDSLRLQATELGIDVDGRWGIARLAYEISQVKH